MPALPGLTITEAGRRFRDGSLSPAKLINDLLDRIERENPRLNAYWEVCADDARELAEAAGKELRTGRDRGPLHGIPLTVKDIFDLEGLPTTTGAHPDFHSEPEPESADLVDILQDAGAIMLGKTSLHEWALGVTTNNPHFGPTRNPHDPDRIPGGSSGGSAAAVAADLCLGALGTDTGGSVRIPAALCGTVGLKPTFGLLSMGGVHPLSTTLDHAGFLTKSVEDAKLLFAHSCRPVSPAPDRIRILLPENYFFEDVDPEVASQVRAAAEKLGPTESVKLPDVQAVWDANTVVLLSEAGALHEERVLHHPDKIGDDVRRRLERGRKYTTDEVQKAQEIQNDWRSRLTRLLGSDAVLATPTTPIPAPPIEESDGVSLSRVLTRFTSPFNLAGVPAISVPCGEVGNLPIGLQLVAAPYRESLLFAAAEANR